MIQELKIFIASPGDLPEERKIVREVCDEINKENFAPVFGVYLKAVGWEDAFPSPGRPQDIINKLLDQSHIFICIFHKRFGSPSGKVESGTLEEFLNAYDSWKSYKNPHILFYFKKADALSLDDLDNPQLRKVLGLKKKIEEEKILLFREFSTSDEFRSQIKDHLEKWITENFSREADSKTTQLPGPLSKPEQDAAFRSYLQSAIREHRHLATQGFETTLRYAIDLEKVFVNLRARPNVHDTEFTKEGREKREKKAREESLPFLDIKAAFQAADRLHVPNLALLGDPGSGKTTLLKYILLVVAEGRGGERLGLKEGLVPFFAPLRELKDPDAESFEDFISRICKLKDYGITPGAFAATLKHGTGIILLDGLDEVADKETRIRTCRWIDRAMDKFPDSRFVATCRYAGYQEESRLKRGVLELAIQDFTFEEAREFLVRWFEAVEMALHPVQEEEEEWRKRGRDKALALAERMEKSQHLRKLAVNPLLLQIIALVHRDRGGALPQRRVELYQECVNVLLEKWDVAKGLDSLITAREARRMLQPLALWLHEKDERRSAPMEEIKKVITPPLVEIGKTGVDPESLLRNIRDRSGIFMGYSEKEYGFVHHSFQEYLAAEEVRNLGKTDLLAANYNNKWWREVILLALALDNPSLLETFLGKILPTEKFQEEPSLVESAMADSIVKPQAPFIKVISDETLSPAIRVNAIRIFAGFKGEDVPRTLKETVKAKESEVARAAYKALKDRGEAEGVEKPRDEIARLIVHAKDNSEMVLIPAGTFLYGSKDDDQQAHSDEKPQRSIKLPAFYMDKYPVTNEKYCRFLNDRKPDKKNLDQWIDLGGKSTREKCRIRVGKGEYTVEKGYSNHPVIFVFWHGAKAYSDWADKRLPTEQEWEKAARGPDGRIYPWGDKFDSGLCNSRESGIGGTTEVDRYQDGQSYYGCFDMAGNVWEWTDGWYDKKETIRPLRGGSWIFVAINCRCASRIGDHPVFRNNDVGFRCARTLTL